MIPCGLFFALAAPAALPVDPPPPARAVAVAIVVDQLAAWVAQERLPLLPEDGGFARLRREGTWHRSIAFPYATTQTAPGHASLFTGALPSEHGIVANNVWRSDLGKRGSLIADPEARLVGETGTLDRTGVSLKLLRVPTIADRLIEKHPDAAVISISLKDRGAVFAASRSRRPGSSQIVWQDSSTGRLVTSDTFAPELPSWARGASPEAAPITWSPLSLPFLRRNATTPDDQPGEDDGLGDRSFPHVVLPGASDTWTKFRLTPPADRLIVDLALRALAALPASGGPVLLAISFTSNDEVGHRFGPDSWEAWDELLRLDGELERLFDGLDAKRGRGTYTVVLSADHGIPPLPEVRSVRRPAGYDLPAKDDPKGIRIATSPVLRSLPADAPRVVDWSENLVSLTEGFAADQGERVRKALARVPGIMKVYDLNREVCGLPADRRMDETLRLVRNATACDGPRSAWGDFFVVRAKGSFFAAPPDATDHGSHYLYDRAVPLLVRLADGVTPKEEAPASFRTFYDALWLGLTGG